MDPESVWNAREQYFREAAEATFRYSRGLGIPSLIIFENSQFSTQNHLKSQIILCRDGHDVVARTENSQNP